MPLLAKLLVLAIAAQVALTFAILILMGRERVPRVMRGEIKVADIAVERTAWPLKARLLSNSFDNQFQLPVLWVGVPPAWEVAAAWVFVLLRIAHAYIHTTSNHVFRRFGVYSAGLAVLGVLWLMVLIRILLV
jgi:hypothetical protein